MHPVLCVELLFSKEEVPGCSQHSSSASGVVIKCGNKDRNEGWKGKEKVRKRKVGKERGKGEGARNALAYSASRQGSAV